MGGASLGMGAELAQVPKSPAAWASCWGQGRRRPCSNFFKPWSSGLLWLRKPRVLRLAQPAHNKLYLE